METPDDKAVEKKHKGRKAGAQNVSTRLATHIKNSVFASWMACDGPAMLVKLAEEKPLDYLRLVASLLPKDVKVDAQLLTANVQVHSLRSDTFRKFVLDRCLDREPTTQDALEALDSFEPTDESMVPGRQNSDDSNANSGGLP